MALFSVLCCHLGASDVCHCVFFFFKQKTAYEMRISDWSSDVSSSDLLSKNDARRKLKGCAVKSGERGENGRSGGGRRRNQTASVGQGLGGWLRRRPRSEEHTSELQSLMRISYAVFCLKKKTTTKHSTQNTEQVDETEQ